MIEINNLTKTFHTPGGDLNALSNVSISIADGDIFGIIGMSGAGKSTMVRCMNMLEHPSEGEVWVDGVNLNNLTDKELREARKSITMIFQSFNLLMQKNCLRNVCFPLELSGVKKEEAQARALELLDMVGLKDKAYAYPAQLSGGQQQRVAIARALATNPKVLLCDEATSALDPTTTNSILELIRDINAKMGITVVIITHQMSVVESICKHVAILDHGTVVESGEVTEVFSRPKSLAAKRMVFPEGAADTMSHAAAGEHFIRVVFNGSDAADKPMIARLAKELGIEASISYASIRTIEQKVFGSLLLRIKDDPETILKVIRFLEKEEGIEAKEVNADV